MSRAYCKAYTLSDVRQFSGWIERQHSEDGNALTDDSICFVCDDFTVVSNPVSDSKEYVLFDDVTPEWRTFCTEVLGFNVPEEVAQIYASYPAEGAEEA